MNIQHFGSEQLAVEVGHLKAGDVFAYHGRFCMRVYVTDVQIPADTVTVVYLDSGTVIGIRSDTMVKEQRHLLHIEGDAG